MLAGGQGKQRDLRPRRGQAHRVKQRAILLPALLWDSLGFTAPDVWAGTQRLGRIPGPTDGHANHSGARCTTVLHSASETRTG